ncbi:hypothetical protein BANRA_04031 [Acinetobacter baumannii]|nr:hypothetical protein BANRA_04031 [Acinetobacter baumannii]
MGWKGKKPTEFSFDVAKTAERKGKKLQWMLFSL